MIVLYSTSPSGTKCFQNFLCHVPSHSRWVCTRKEFPWIGDTPSRCTSVSASAHLLVGVAQCDFVVDQYVGELRVFHQPCRVAYRELGRYSVEFGHAQMPGESRVVNKAVCFGHVRVGGRRQRLPRSVVRIVAVGLGVCDESAGTLRRVAQGGCVLGCPSPYILGSREVALQMAFRRLDYSIALTLGQHGQWLVSIQRVAWCRQPDPRRVGVFE